MSKIPTKADYQLRNTDPRAEMEWLVMVDDSPEWCETEALANERAGEALRNSRMDGYTVKVHVLKSIRQNGAKP